MPTRPWPSSGNCGDEMTQKYFEDFAIGDRFGSPGKTLTDAHFMFFAGMTGDAHPIHYDDEYAKRHRFGRRLAHGLLLASMTAVGASTLAPLIEGSIIAFVEQTTRFIAPAFVGDTITPAHEVVGLEPRRLGRPADPPGDLDQPARRDGPRGSASLSDRLPPGRLIRCALPALADPARLPGPSRPSIVVVVDRPSRRRQVMRTRLLPTVLALLTLLLTLGPPSVAQAPLDPQALIGEWVGKWVGNDLARPRPSRRGRGHPTRSRSTGSMAIGSSPGRLPRRVQGTRNVRATLSGNQSHVWQRTVHHRADHRGRSDARGRHRRRHPHA